MVNYQEILNATRYWDNQQKEMELAEKSLSAFIKQAWHVIESQPYVHGWHIDAMSEHLEAITNGELTRLVINVPPGAMKSLIVNVFYPAWEWGPKFLTHYRNLSTSHMLNLSIRDTMKMRRLIMSDWYRNRYPHVVLTKDQNAKTKFENTLMGFQESMAFGSLTGSRGDRLKIDDPLSVDDARSKAILESRKLTFTEAVPTRLISPAKSAIILIMQRLNELDTTQLALELGYVHLMLPMEFEKNRRCTTTIGFSDPRLEDGDLLFPGRFPREVVDGLKASMGSFGAACQLQQSPVPREGGIIKFEWWKYYNLQKDGSGRVLNPQFNWIIQSWDTAFKTGQENDYSVCTTWGFANNNFYLIDRWKGKVEFPELLRVSKMLYTQFMPSYVLVEDKASGQSLIQALKRDTNLPIKPRKADNDKSSRLNAVSGYIENGKTFIPDNEPWVRDYIDVMSSFPNGAHDDDVDSTSQALNFMAHTSRPNVTSNFMGR